MQLQEVMTQNIQCAEPTSTMADAARMMRDLSVGSIPVCEGDRLLGLVTDRDIATRCVAQDDDPRQCKLADHMSRDLVIGTPTMSVEEALELMKTGQIRRLPVVEGDRLVGMVSLGDLSVETGGEPEVASALGDISRPVHQSDEAQAA